MTFFCLNIDKIYDYERIPNTFFTTESTKENYIMKRAPTVLYVQEVLTQCI